MISTRVFAVVLQKYVYLYLFLEYDCFTHELHIPEGHPFFLLKEFVFGFLSPRTNLSWSYRLKFLYNWASTTCTQRANFGQLALRSASLDLGF